MPIADLTAPRGLSEEHKAALVKDLTDLIIKSEKGADAPGYGYPAWTFVHEAEGFAIAGQVCPAGKAPLEFGKK